MRYERLCLPKAAVQRTALTLFVIAFLTFSPASLLAQPSPSLPGTVAHPDLTFRLNPHATLQTGRAPAIEENDTDAALLQPLALCSWELRGVLSISGTTNAAAVPSSGSAIDSPEDAYVDSAFRLLTKNTSFAGNKQLDGEAAVFGSYRQYADLSEYDEGRIGLSGALRWSFREPPEDLWKLHNTHATFGAELAPYESWVDGSRYQTHLSAIAGPSWIGRAGEDTLWELSPYYAVDVTTDHAVYYPQTSDLPRDYFDRSGTRHDIGIGIGFETRSNSASPAAWDGRSQLPNDWSNDTLFAHLSGNVIKTEGHEFDSYGGLLGLKYRNAVSRETSVSILVELGLQSFENVSFFDTGGSSRRDFNPRIEVGWHYANSWGVLSLLVGYEGRNSSVSVYDYSDVFAGIAFSFGSSPNISIHDFMKGLDHAIFTNYRSLQVQKPIDIGNISDEEEDDKVE